MAAPLLTTPLRFKVGDAQWAKLRQRAIDDLYFFNAVVLGFANVFKLEEETHLVAHRFLQRTTGVPEIDSAPFQLLEWPRETGKSSCGTIGWAIWYAVTHPETAILIANENAQNASDFVTAIEHHFESNALLRALFPEVIPDDFSKVAWNSERAELVRSTRRPEPTFDSIGVGGTKTGKHYDVIICDDLISREAAENARAGSWGIMDRTNRWVNQLVPLLSQGAQPFPMMRFIGTRWYMNDSYEHIEKAFSYEESPREFRVRVRCSSGAVVARTVSRCGDLAIMKIAGIEEGRPVFPRIWSQERMDKLRMMDPEFFACNIMNAPSDASVRTFQDAWLRYWQWLDKTTIHYQTDEGGRRYVPLQDLHRFVVVDPAFTAFGDGSRAAILVLGTDFQTGASLVLDADAARLAPADLTRDILAMAQRWKCNRVYIEAVAQQRGFMLAVEQEARRQNLPIMLEDVKPAGRNKDVRIEGLSAYFKSGRLYLHPSQTDLLKEYRDYKPGARQKDLLDALAYAMEARPSVTGQTRSFDPGKRSQLAFQHYKSIRGIGA